MTTLGVAHAAPVLLARDASAEVAATWVRRAARESVEVLAFAESFLPGFPAWVNLAPPAQTSDLFAALYQQAVPTAEMRHALQPIIDACQEGGVDVVIGLTERQGGTLYNSLAFVDSATGEIPLVRRKLVPTGAERALWGYGDGSTLRTTTLRGRTVSGLMCYEHVMPLARHAIAAEQPEVHVAAWPGMAGLDGYGGFHTQVDALARSHAIMAQCFVLSAMNPVPGQHLERIFQTIPDHGLMRESGAWSAIIGPTGITLADYEGSDERLVIAQVDLADRVRAKRIVDTGHFGRAECLTLQVDRAPYSYLRVVDQ